MEKLVTYLQDWFKLFLENRDLMLRKIVKITEHKGKLDFEFKDKRQIFMIFPNLEECNVADLEDIENIGIVTFNTEENLKWLIKRWDGLARITTLVVYFVNPFSQLDKRWIVHPHTHNKICESDSLAQGLRSMFEMVEPITLSAVEKKI